MAKDWAESFYNSKKWKDCRESFMQSKNYICENCKSVAIICHHKTWLTPGNINDPYISLNWDNLQSLCTECHQKIHGNNSITVEGLAFDSEGNLVKDPPY